MRRSRRRPTLLALTLVVSGVLPGTLGGTAASADDPVPTTDVPSTTTTPAPPNVPDDAARLVAVRPCRLLDQRQTGTPTIATPAPVQVGGRCGVPTDAVAAVLTVSSVGGQLPGYATAWPAGGVRPLVSVLNVVPGDTRSNTVSVRLSADGRISLASTVGAPLVVDVTAAYVPVAGPAASGRLVPLPPSRLLDTRRTGGRAAGAIDVPLPAGVPADATALAVNLTIVDSASAGYLTVHPAGTERPLAAAATVDRAGQTRSVGAVVPVGAGGFTVFRSMRSDLVVDVTGWYTGPSAGPAVDGLFVPVDPVRVWDTRTDVALTGGGGLERPLLPADVAGRAAAVAVNVAADGSFGPGWIAARPAGTAPVGPVATVNPEGAAPTANHAIVPLSGRGAVFTSLTTTDVVVDLFGWFVGDPVVAVEPVPANPLPAPPRTLLVSDSVFASMRWEGTLDVLRGGQFVTDLQSCRRLIGDSCRGREGFAPSNALDAITAAPGPFDVVVVAVGYNDPAHSFASAFEQVVAAARRQGARRIVWVTYREDTAYRSPFGWTSAEVFASHNRTVRAQLATGRYPDVVLADWWAYTEDVGSWFPDGIHHSPLAAVAAPDWLSRWVARVARRPCPVGNAATQVCPDPDVTGASTDVWSLYRSGPPDFGDEPAP